MDDSKTECILVGVGATPEREPISREDYDRLKLFRHAVLQRSRLAGCSQVKDQYLLDEIDARKVEISRGDSDTALHGLLRAAVQVLLGSDVVTPTEDLCTELSKYKAEQNAFSQNYVRLRAAAQQLLTYPPNAGTPGLIDGLEKLTQEKVLPLDDVDDANSLQRINSELEDEVMFLNSRLVHAIRAAHHMTALALDVACERQGGEGCSHD